MGFTERTVRKLPLNYDVTWNYRADGLGIGGSSPTIPQENDGGNNGNTSSMFEEVFTADGISATFTVTKNDGILADSLDKIFVSRNGQYIGNEYISDLSPQDGEITLGFVPESGEEITLNWFAKPNTQQPIFQEIFTADGISAQFTVTKNNGELPSAYTQILNNNYLTGLDAPNGQVSLTFTPFSGERIAIVWFYRQENIEPYKQSFTADGLSGTFTVTNNDGILSDYKDAILVMRNGQLIDNDYISSFNKASGEVILTFTPDNNEKIEIIWFVLI
jgi:hypothetical protein